MSIRHKTGLGYEDLQNKVKYVYIFKQSYMPPELLLDFVLVYGYFVASKNIFKDKLAFFPFGFSFYTVSFFIIGDICKSHGIQYNDLTKVSWPVLNIGGHFHKQEEEHLQS